MALISSFYTFLVFAKKKNDISTRSSISTNIVTFKLRFYSENVARRTRLNSFFRKYFWKRSSSDEKKQMSRQLGAITFHTTSIQMDCNPNNHDFLQRQIDNAVNSTIDMIGSNRGVGASFFDQGGGNIRYNQYDTNDPCAYCGIYVPNSGMFNHLSSYHGWVRCEECGEEMPRRFVIGHVRTVHPIRRERKRESQRKRPASSSMGNPSKTVPNRNVETQTAEPNEETNVRQNVSDFVEDGCKTPPTENSDSEGSDCDPDRPSAKRRRIDDGKSSFNNSAELTSNLDASSENVENNLNLIFISDELLKQLNANNRIKNQNGKIIVLDA